MKKILIIFLIILSIFLLNNCKSKRKNNHKDKNLSNRKRVVYKWHKTLNSSCFLKQGGLNCWHASIIKINKNLFSVRIKPNPFKRYPILKFTLRNISSGVKKAPENDVSYNNGKGALYTNYDSTGLNIVKIQNHNRIISGDFNFKLRNSSGKWIYFTQGYFKTKLNY